MNKKNTLGQFYTPYNIAEHLASKSLEYITTPRNVLELAAGEGQLLNALEKLYSSFDVYAIDLDPKNISFMSKNHPNWNVFNADSTKEIDCLGQTAFDLALGNPPFMMHVCVSQYIHSLLKEVLGIHLKVGEKTRAEYIFICQYLKLLKEGGLLTIIVPDSILSGARSSSFRKALLNNFEILCVEEIESSSFSLTEAKTHILYIRRGKGKDIKSLKINSIEQRDEEIVISLAQAINRMDFSFYSKNRLQPKHNRVLCRHASITRGKHTHKELKSKYKNFIHSTSFDIDFNYSKSQFSKNDLLSDGDLIMCRVGTRVVGKLREYKGQPVPFSDCIYRIRFYDYTSKLDFLNLYQSNHGKQVLEASTRGVCSRYITKKDLSAFLF